MAWYTSTENAVNTPPLPEAWQNRIVTGKEAVEDALVQSILIGAESLLRPYFFAFDGFKGVQFANIIDGIAAKLRAAGMEVITFNVNRLFRNKEELDELARPYEKPTDPSFGWVFNGRLEDFIDRKKLQETLRLWDALREECGARKVLLCYGVGAAMESWRYIFDEVMYSDLTRDELIVRSERNKVPPVGSDVPEGFPWKRIYYLEYPALNRHKRELLKVIQWYIDDSVENEPKLIPADVYHALITELSGRPISFKIFYMPGVFGGYEFGKRFKVANLPNTSWDYEVSVADNHMLVDIGKERILNLPFYNVFWEHPLRVLGTYSCTTYPHHFPIAIYMQDGFFAPDDKAGFKRTHMPLHLHPDTAYNRERFGEPLGRYETYYIVRADEGACTMHGFKDDADVDEFVEQVKNAEVTGNEFDWRQYIYEHPSKSGELHQLPPGTVHGTGGRQIILEIDTQPSRDSTEYSFFLYDYHRPTFNYQKNDFTGQPMKLHLEHGLAVMRKNRKQNLMSQMCRPDPVCIRQGADWRELSFPMYFNMPYQINRFEFYTSIEDDTRDMFHCIALTKGQRVRVYSKRIPSNQFILEDCDNIILPACFGPYVCENLGEGNCEIIKTLLITEPREHIDHAAEDMRIASV